MKVGTYAVGHQPDPLKTGIRPEIRVVEGDWGGARPEEIELVLNIVADQILIHFPGRKLSPITVSPTAHNPVVLFQKSADDRYQVHLAAKGQKWAEYIYEFSHELFHIVANYQNNAPPKTATHLWLEESLCESASVYTLKKLSLTWEETPPVIAWASYASTLKQFTRRLLGEQQHYLPPDLSLTRWLEENERYLITDPYLRDKNALVANLFLPLLEQNQDWEAIAFLNGAEHVDHLAFRDYLAGWHERTPPEHQELTRRAMQIFGFQSPVVPARTETSNETQGERNSLSEHVNTASSKNSAKERG